jgi:HlyD family secretion protein
MTESANSQTPFLGEPIRIFVKKYWLIIVLLLVLVFVLIFLSYYYSRPKKDYLFLSGRLEGYETDISPKYGGKVIYVVGREGRRVKKNELLVKIDDAELQAQLKAAEANLSVSQQQESQARLQLNIIQNQINLLEQQITVLKDSKD